ncbi:pyrroloquinoline quinone precursor peptide PqqA [Methylocystis sp. Sn-Cys]|uniref:pyrroloquinoline quinone precursor peptide PqqA n=1 Tax=Methylocystis TaxID=133 RepID=UPI00351C8625
MNDGLRPDCTRPFRKRAVPSSRHAPCRDAWTSHLCRTHKERGLPPRQPCRKRGHKVNCTAPSIMIMLSPSSNLPQPIKRPTRAGSSRQSSNSEDIDMAWTTPVIVEVCVGMEVTSYSSAEI